MRNIAAWLWHYSKVESQIKCVFRSCANWQWRVNCTMEDECPPKSDIEINNSLGNSKNLPYQNSDVLMGI